MISFHQLKNMILLLIVGISFGTTLLIGVYVLPTDRMYNNLKGSEDFYKLGEFPQWSKSMDHTTLDNFTDSIMILKAVYPVKNPIVDSMLIPSWNPVWNGQYAAARGLVQIVEAGHLETSTDQNIYPRYWHGYLTVLKPMLMILKLDYLRVLNLYIQFFLAVTAIMLLYKKLGIYYAYAFAIVILIINPISAALSFQFTNVYCTTLLTVIFILLFNDKLKQGNRYTYFFMSVGMLTAYMDFLTYPPVPLGIGLTLYFSLNKDTLLKGKATSLFFNQLNKAFSWAFGYAGMWSGKVLVATLLTDYDIFHDVLREVTIRMSHHDGHNMEGPSISIVDAVFRSLHTFSEGPVKYILLFTAIYFIYLVIIKRKKFILNKLILSAFAFIVAIPFAWYAVACNHSMMHNYLAYRDLSIAAFGVLAFFVESIGGLRR